jgi:O-antigen/teichoic acid export membrane protein
MPGLPASDTALAMAGIDSADRIVTAPSLRRRFSSSVGWNAVCTIALQGGTFATNLLLANLLGATQYGQFGFIVSSAQTLGSVLQLSVGLAATKFIAEHRRSQPAIAAGVLAFSHRLSIWTGLLGTLGFAAFALAGASGSHAFQGLRMQLVVAAPIVFCAVLSGLQTGALAGLEGFAATARVVAPLMFLQVISAGVAAHFLGLDGALLAITAHFILRTLALEAVLRREARVAGIDRHRAQGLSVRRMVVGFIVPSAVSGFTNLPALWLATWALVGTAGAYSDVGRLNAALTIRGALMILPWMVNAVGFSLLNAHLTRPLAGDYRRILGVNLLLCAGSAALGAVCVAVFGDTILRAYGPDFVQATAVLRILVLSLMAEALMWPLYQALLSKRLVWRALLFTQLPRDAIIAVVGMRLAIDHGALGVAWAHVAGWAWALLGCAVLLVLLQRETAHK